MLNGNKTDQYKIKKQQMKERKKKKDTKENKWGEKRKEEKKKKERKLKHRNLPECIAHSFKVQSHDPLAIMGSCCPSQGSETNIIISINNKC